MFACCKHYQYISDYVKTKAQSAADGINNISVSINNNKNRKMINNKDYYAHLNENSINDDEDDNINDINENDINNDRFTNTIDTFGSGHGGTKSSSTNTNISRKEGEISVVVSTPFSHFIGQLIPWVIVYSIMRIIPGIARLWTLVNPYNIPLWFALLHNYALASLGIADLLVWYVILYFVLYILYCFIYD